jgi:hypothetical protein
MATIADLLKAQDEYNAGTKTRAEVKTVKLDLVLNLELKHVGWFVMGMVDDYLLHTERGGEAINGELRRNLYSSCLEAAHQYMRTDQTNVGGLWSDLQCSVALEAKKVFMPGFYVMC